MSCSSLKLGWWALGVWPSRFYGTPSLPGDTHLAPSAIVFQHHDDVSVSLLGGNPMGHKGQDINLENKNNKRVASLIAWRQ